MRRKKQQRRQRSIGKAVKVFRIQHGFTQQQMGELLGINAKQVSALEVGTIQLKSKQDFIRKTIADLTPKTIKPVKRTVTQVKDTTLEIAKQTVETLSKTLEKQVLLVIRSLVDQKLQEQ